MLDAVVKGSVTFGIRQARSWLIAPTALVVVVAWLTVRGTATGLDPSPTQRPTVASVQTALDQADDDHGHGPHAPGPASVTVRVMPVTWRAQPGAVADQLVNLVASPPPRLLRRLKLPGHGDEAVPPY